MDIIPYSGMPIQQIHYEEIMRQIRQNCGMKRIRFDYERQYPNDFKRSIFYRRKEKMYEMRYRNFDFDMIFCTKRNAFVVIMNNYVEGYVAMFDIENNVVHIKNNPRKIMRNYEIFRSDPIIGEKEIREKRLQVREDFGHFYYFHQEIFTEKDYKLSRHVENDFKKTKRSLIPSYGCNFHHYFVYFLEKENDTKCYCHECVGEEIDPAGYYIHGYDSNIEGINFHSEECLCGLCKYNTMIREKYESGEYREDKKECACFMCYFFRSVIMEARKMNLWYDEIYTRSTYVEGYEFIEYHEYFYLLRLYIHEYINLKIEEFSTYM